MPSSGDYPFLYLVFDVQLPVKIVAPASGLVTRCISDYFVVILDCTHMEYSHTDLDYILAECFADVQLALNIITPAIKRRLGLKNGRYVARVSPGGGYWVLDDVEVHFVQVNHSVWWR